MKESERGFESTTACSSRTVHTCRRAALEAQLDAFILKEEEANGVHEGANASKAYASTPFATQRRPKCAASAREENDDSDDSDKFGSDSKMIPRAELSRRPAGFKEAETC